MAVDPAQVNVTVNTQGTDDHYDDHPVVHRLPDGHPDKPPVSRSVLIAVDDSELAERAMRWYVGNLHKPENFVIVFSVADPPNVQGIVAFGAGFGFPTDDWANLIEEKKREYHALQLKYANLMRTLGLHGKVTIFWSDGAGHGIENYVKTNNRNKDSVPISLIVMGSRGRGKVRRTFMGSVSSYVLHHTHVPTLIVPPPVKHH